MDEPSSITWRQCLQLRSRGSGAAIGTINGDEVRGAFDTPPFDHLAQLIQPAIGTNHSLKTCGFPGDRAHPGDVIQQFCGTIDGELTVRADGIHTLGNASNAGNFCTDLSPGQNTALDRLGTLAELISIIRTY